MDFFNIMREKHPSNDHHFPAHKCKYFFKLFSFSVATLYNLYVMHMKDILFMVSIQIL